MDRKPLKPEPVLVLLPFKFCISGILSTDTNRLHVKSCIPSTQKSYLMCGPGPLSPSPQDLSTEA